MGELEKGFEVGFGVGFEVGFEVCVLRGDLYVMDDSYVVYDVFLGKYICVCVCICECMCLYVYISKYNLLTKDIPGKC